MQITEAPSIGASPNSPEPRSLKASPARQVCLSCAQPSISTACSGGILPLCFCGETVALRATIPTQSLSISAVAGLQPQTEGEAIAKLYSLIEAEPSLREQLLCHLPLDLGVELLSDGGCGDTEPCQMDFNRFFILLVSRLYAVAAHTETTTGDLQ